MNKLLQHIMDAGGGTNKFLPYLEQFQTTGEFKGKSPLLQLAARQAPVYDNIPNPASFYSKAVMDTKTKQAAAYRAMRAKQGEIRTAGPKRSMASKALAIAAHPMTAASYVVKGQDIPDNFEKGPLNIYDFASPILNPASAVYAGAQIPGNLRDGEFLQAGLNTLAVLPGFTTVPKATRAVLNAADRNMSKVGKALVAIEKEGKAAGLTDFEIAKRQLDQVGITSNQRQAYVPGVSDLVRKYVTPYGYSGMGSGNKVKEIIENIKRGGIDVDASQVSGARGDAWRMYLGIPQKNRTFRMAETAPVNHRAYSPKQLKDMDIYSLNQEAEIADDILASTKHTTPASIRDNVDNLTAESFVEVDPVDVMGNYNARFTKDGLQYNDIWDLNPSIAPARLLPKKLRQSLDNHPLFYSKTQIPGANGNMLEMFTPRKIDISVDKFLGKPFMSHGNLGLTASQYRNSVINALEDKLWRLSQSPELGDMTPIISRVKDQLDQVRQTNVIKEEGGETPEYKGHSIVDYLATRGYSGKKAFRKGLAEQYGVADYDFSAAKNLELLAKIRENDDLLEANKQDFDPVSVQRIEEMHAAQNQAPAPQDIARAVEQEKQIEKRKAFENLRRRMTLQFGYDPFLEGPKVPKINVPEFSLSSKSPYGKNSLVNGLQGQGSVRPQPTPAPAKQPVPAPQVRPAVQPVPATQPAPAVQPVAGTGWRFDKAPVPNTSTFYPFQQFPPFPTRQMAQLPKGRTAQVAAKELEKESEDKAWYERAWDAFSQAVNNNPILRGGNMTMGGAGFTPEGARQINRDITRGALSLISEDLAEKYENKMQRQDAKLNPKERKSNFDPAKVQFDPVYVTGDTIPDSKRRYHIPEVMDLDYIRFGVRNRGDMREIQTEGAPITTFEPFQSSKQYFAKTQDPANATYIGVAPDGRIKVGGRDQFQDQDYQVTRTFGNKIVDFNRDKAGSIVKVPSNPKASKETLSPSVKVLDDNGKVVDGKLSLLLPRAGNQEESFDLVTGGRYIFQTPDGKTKLVSGSLKNIETEFYNMKKNHPWINVITLDNGSYARGIRTFDQKLTKQDLKGYDNQNTGGGNFAYILPGERKTRYESKFTDFEAAAKQRLQSLYPGKKVSIAFQNTGLYDKTGGRDIESQVGIQKRGNSQTPVSLHNFGAAKDYILIVDGKELDPEVHKKVYKDVLWNSADKTGLYHLEDWDPAHISLAKEGQKTAFDELYAKYPDLFANPTFIRSLNYVNKNKSNPIYEEYFELLNNIQPFTGKPRTTEVMKRNTAKKQSGGPIVDPRGQWAYPGMDTVVPTPTGEITMQGVPYPVYGQDETGYGQMMYPGGEYSFPGQMVYERPMMKVGGSLPKFQGSKSGSTVTPEQMQSVMSYMGVKPAVAKQPMMQSQVNSIVNRSSSRPMVATNTRQQAETKRQAWIQNQPKMLEEERKQRLAEEQQELAEEQQRVAERKAAVATADNGAPFTFPSGQTKAYKDMDWREKSYVAGKALEQRGRFNEDRETWYDDINPLNMLGSLSGGLATAPYQAKQQNSVLPYFTSVGSTLAAGAFAGAGAKSTGQFINNALNPLADIGSGVKSYAKDLGYSLRNNRSLPTYRTVTRWQADQVPMGLRQAGEELTEQQKSLTGSWYTYKPKEQLGFYMDTRPGPGRVDVLRMSDRQISELEKSMPNYAKGMSGKASVATSDHHLPGELVVPKEMRSRAKSIRFDVNPREYVIPEGIDLSSPLGREYGRMHISDFATGVVNSNYGNLLGIPRKYLPFKHGGQQKMQWGKQVSSQDSVRNMAGKILNYEQLRGGPGGTPLPQYSDPRYMQMLMQNIYPEVKRIMPNASAMEIGEAMDFIFNAGWDKDANKIQKDPRAYALQEYYRKHDPSKLDKDGKWPGRKNPAYSFDQEYNATIGKLSENERRILMNKGRDWYYKNINNPAPGVPSSDYNDTWYGRMWNTNEYAPFNAMDPRFIPKKKQGGEMIRRADGSYSPRGLWDNIRANKGSGKKPTKQMLEQERKIKAKNK